MIKDRLLKLIFIPILALTIPYGAGIITYHKYNTIELIGSFLFYLLVSFTLWSGCIWSHEKVRRARGMIDMPLKKILSIYSLSFFLTCAVGINFCLVWMAISKETFSWLPIFKFCILSVGAVSVFTLIYEVLYLTKERQVDNKIVDQLDNELTHAEMAALRNELDPHFIFNSLNTLSQLIVKDSAKADMFNNKLAEVYKYFLINKEKELVTAEMEIEFIKSYFFLLQIRHGDKLELHFNLGKTDIKHYLVIPCALQILIENAIKHNEFTSHLPLKISITADEQHLTVQNNIMKRAVILNSTRIGLRNLSKQYLLVNKTISIQENGNSFIVKLPLIKVKQLMYD